MVSFSITHDTGETFTFADGMIKSSSTHIEMSEPDENVQPGAGPMENQIYDSNGTTKILTVMGVLYDTTESVTSQSNVLRITQMKYWLESLANGAQKAKPWTGPYDQYSLEDGDGTTVIDGVNIPGTWVPTLVYLIAIDFPDTTELVGNQLPFTMTLKVVGF